MEGTVTVPGRQVQFGERTQTDPERSSASSAGDPQTSLGYLDGLLRYAGGVMYVKSHPEGRYLLANPGFEELVGLPATEIVGRTGDEIFPADVDDAHRANDRLVAADGVARTSREPATDADGTMRDYVSHKFALLDPDGEIYALGGFSTDVTQLEEEREVGRCAQQETEARFQAVFNHAPIGQIYSSLDGWITSVNEPLAVMLGWEPAELAGRHVRTLLDDHEYGRVRETTAALLAGEVRSVSALRHYIRRDGRRLPVRVTSALLRSDTGEPRWWVSMVIDIAEEERTRAELERAHVAALMSARRLRLLNAIATAANDSASAVQLAPHVLDAVCAHFGWQAGALVHLTPERSGRLAAVRVSDAAGPDVRARLVDIAATVGPLGSDEVTATDQVVFVPVPRADSSQWAWLFVDEQGEYLDDDQYEVLRLIGVETARVVEREAAEKRLRDSEERFRSVFDASPLPMALTLGDSGSFSAVNDALCLLLGRRAEDLIGHSARDLVHPDDIALTDPAGAAAAAAPDGRHRVELRFLHSSGTVVITIVTLTWMHAADGSQHLLAQMEDITARRLAEETLHQQLEEDTPTGLANRTGLSRELREMADANASCAVLFIDLDAFKLINDTRGHDVGDEVLREVAARLRAAVRPSDLVARFGGDEFVVLCRSSRGTLQRAIARRIADRVQSLLSTPIETESGLVTLTASTGIACGAVESGHPQDLVRQADLAMYHAKRLGKDRWEMYDAGLHERALAHQRTEATLRNALAEDRFVLHYQPIVELHDSSILGFEALVRLVDETGQLVAPDKFISVAEQSGLIVSMGTWVLREACRTISDMRRRTGVPLTIAVNVAARQVARPDFLDTVLDALAATGLPEDALALELTESALLEANSSTLNQLTQLRNRGVQIALDDFGTGYSSLTYLRTFPVTQLKVDRSFVSGVTTVAGDLAIVRAVTQLAQDLGLSWVAEGIETPEQQNALAALGPGLGQGYLYSRPVPRDQLDAVLVAGFPPPLRRLARGA